MGQSGTISNSIKEREDRKIRTKKISQGSLVERRKNMTSTELTLNRTLTDILEDELYNMYGTHGCGSEHCHSSNVSLNGKSLMNLPLPAFEEFMTNETLATDYNLSPPYASNFFVGSSSSSNIEHPIPMDSQTNGPELCRHSSQHQHISQSHTQQQAQSENFTIFNKYADPSLTTTSIHDNKPQDKLGNTPVQKTINLNSIMKVPNPFNTVNISRLHPQPSIIPRDIRVTNDDSMDSSENIYAEQEHDEFLGYEDSCNFKVNWPLQDSNLALSNEDARMIFDHEFQHDDDLSDDDDNDEETFQENPKRDIFNVPFAYSNEFNMSNSRDKEINACNFVDSNISTNNNMIPDEVILDDDDDDSNMLDEDDLYEPSYRNSRKESVVFNNTREMAVPGLDRDQDQDQYQDQYQGQDQDQDRNQDNVEQSRQNARQKVKLREDHQQQPRSRVKELEIESEVRNRNQRQLGNKTQSRKKILNNENNLVNTSKRRVSSMNTLEPLQYSQSHSHLKSNAHLHDHSHSQSPSPSQPYSKQKNSDGSEVYTCMIINSITKQVCAAQFSRSYDLTRHQNTIHAKKKSVFRCSECIKSIGHEGYQKTFSRLDALTRHIKSKHEYLTLEQRQDITKYARDNMGYVVA